MSDILELLFPKVSLIIIKQECADYKTVEILLHFIWLFCQHKGITDMYNTEKNSKYCGILSFNLLLCVTISNLTNLCFMNTNDFSIQ